MDGNNDKKPEDPAFDDILVIRKKKAEVPPPPPPEDDSITDGFSEDETSRYNAVEIKEQTSERRLSRKQVIVIAGMSIVLIVVLLLGVLISFMTGGQDEPEKPATAKTDSTPSIIKTYKNIKNKLEDIKNASAERGMKELAEDEQTPAQKAVDSPENEKAKNPYSAYDLLPAGKFAAECLRLLSVGKRKEALECLAGAFIARPDDIKFHDEVRKSVQLAVPNDVERIYSEASIRCGDTLAIPVVLGNLYSANRVWAEAARYYLEALAKSPGVPGLVKETVFARARAGNEKAAFEEYQKFLTASGIPENKKALELLKLTLLFSSPEKTDELLKLSSKYPEDSDDFKYFRLCRDAIYEKLDPSSFSEWDPYSFHDLRVISLLSEGREKDVLLIRVPPSEFPDLWKIFIHWRNDSESWRDAAAQLHEKNSAKGGDPLKKLVSKLWLGEKSPEALILELFMETAEQDSLACFFIAEFYRKNSDTTLSREYYRKASSSRGNIYKNLIEHYSQVK